jgi:hypothetical protein
MQKFDLNFIWQTGGDSVYVVLVGVPAFWFEE